MEKPLKKRKRFKWTMMLVFLCLGYVVYTFADQEQQLTNMRREAETLRARAATLKSENERLQQEQQLLQTDTYIEKVAREELGLVRPGETPYIIGPKVQPR
jgi:cell division protein FtsL